jgi:hypothetical protein
MSGLIRFVCVSDEHYAIGRSVPDGAGLITINKGAWAYCAAARPGEPHDWQEIEPGTLQAMRHARSWKVGPHPSPAATAKPARGSGGRHKSS